MATMTEDEVRRNRKIEHDQNRQRRWPARRWFQRNVTIPRWTATSAASVRSPTPSFS
jgi:hypothetical protein